MAEFPSRLREGLGEGATYVLASGFEARPSLDPSRKRKGRRHQIRVIDSAFSP